MMKKFGVIGLLSIIHLLAISAVPNSHDPNKLSHDNSDWWSLFNVQPKDVTAAQALLPSQDLMITGVSVSDFTFPKVISLLGQADRVRRGDASTGREQICYTSGSKRSPTYLIFEKGEVSSSVYLFSDARPWNGRSLCVAAPRELEPFHTLSGLHLGQTIEEVESILGQPNKRNASELVYLYEGKLSTSPEALSAARKQYPEMSEAQLRAEYGMYDATQYICARFHNSHLTYLAILTTATT